MVFPFEMDAMEGKPLVYGLDIADSCLYLGLKYIYAMYRKGVMTRKEASAEKDVLARNWTKDKSTLEFLNRDSVALKCKIGDAAEKYRKNPTSENADKLYAALYNLPVNWRGENEKD